MRADIRLKRNQHLSWLHYYVGKQQTLFEVQKQVNKETQLVYFKRKYFIEVDWTLSYNDDYNNRTTLVNEIVIDLDPKDFDLNPKKYASNLRRVKSFLDTKEDWIVKYYTSGSKGVHIHCYVQQLFLLSDYDRYSFKKEVIDYCKGDGMLKSEHTTITMEYSQNAKTGRLKVPIDVDADLFSKVLIHWRKEI